MQPAGGQPIAQFVIVGRDRKHHAHVEGLALGLVLLDNRFQGRGRDRMHRLAVFLRDMFLHLRPDLVRHGDAVAVEVHGERGDDMRLGAEADGGRQRLARQHMRAVQGTADHAIQQHLPIGLRFQGDKQPFVEEIALFIGHGERRHIGELDEAKGQLVLFELQRLCQNRRGQKDRGRDRRKKLLHDHCIPCSCYAWAEGTQNAEKAADAHRPTVRQRVERLCSKRVPVCGTSRSLG